MKYSDRGAIIDVYIEIIEETCTNPADMISLVNAACEDDSAMNDKNKSFDDGVESSALQKPGSFRGITEKPGSLKCSMEMFSDAKACAKDMKALFGSSGIIPNTNLDRLKYPKETSPLAAAVVRKPAMLVVHVVDSGIGLTGLT